MARFDLIIGFGIFDHGKREVYFVLAEPSGLCQLANKPIHEILARAAQCFGEQFVPGHVIWMLDRDGSTIFINFDAGECIFTLNRFASELFLLPVFHT
jgi:hypothetical protein